jgi:hypothetical protein
MAAILELSAEEAAMNGAPEGELYVANVIEREEVAAPDDADELFAELEEELGSIAKAPWHKQFTYADRCRQVIIHATGLITSQFADGVSIEIYFVVSLKSLSLCSIIVVYVLQCFEMIFFFHIKNTYDLYLYLSLALSSQRHLS